MIKLDYYEIVNLFNDRILKTNNLVNVVLGCVKELNVEIETQLYFKYYFDVFTTLERTIRSIAQVKSENDQYIEYLSKGADKSKPFLVPVQELKAMIHPYSIVPSDKYIDEIENLIFSKVVIYRKKANHNLIKNEDMFYEKYNELRNARNNLSHGLDALNNVEFTNAKLTDHLNVLYLVLMKYAELTLIKEYER